MAGSTSMGQNVESGGTAAMHKNNDRDRHRCRQGRAIDQRRWSERLAIQPACRGSDIAGYKIKTGDQIDITWDTSVTLAPQ